MEIKDMTKDERSLLLLFEHAQVDQGGKVSTETMNAEDRATAKRWAAEGFCEFGRARASGGWDQNVGKCRVRLSDEAWRLAHAERRARANRIAARVDKAEGLTI